MGGAIGPRSFARFGVLVVAWTANAAAQTAPPPAAQPVPAAAPAPPATAAFPTAPAPPPQAPAAAAAPPHALPPPAHVPQAPRRAVVRFEADEPGALLQSDTTADGRSVPWYVVCEAPCTRSVSTNGSYRIGGYGFHESRDFRIPDDRGEVAIRGEMENSSIAFPMAITIVGGVFASVGGMIALGGFAEEEEGRNGEDLIVSGTIVGSAGVLVATIGVVMLLVDAENDESRARVANGALELPAGVSLGPRGFTF